MIPRAVLTRIDRQAVSGRTGPVLAACESGDGDEIEVFVKLSAGCDQGVVNLAREVIAACLADDLCLPVPKPWLVDIPPEIIDVISNDCISERLRDSCSVAFGSTRSVGFSIWTSGQSLTDAMDGLATGILLFDGIIQNSDRRVDNPNCLVSGENLRIIDHELAFANDLIVGWQPPWVVGGLGHLATPERHIFLQELKSKELDFEPIRARWTGLTDARLQQYSRSIPTEWGAASGNMDAALRLVADARDRIDDCIVEMVRVLS